MDAAPVVIGNATLYFGDCLEVLPTLDKVDAVVTDPPYGIGKDGNHRSSGSHRGRKAYDFLKWDSTRPSAQCFAAILAAADVHVIWGGNYFADLLPPRQKWLVWDKGQRIDQSDGEFAWTSMAGASRICTINRAALTHDGSEHPTQKPVRLMKWTIDQIRGVADTILDPFAGSGSTGVAAVQMGRKFIGIEREPRYFDIACRRIEDAQRTDDMFGHDPRDAYEKHDQQSARLEGFD